MQELKNLLKQKIKNLYNIELEDIILDVPPKKELGDFTFSPFNLAKELKRSPIEISNELMNELNKPLIQHVNEKDTLLLEERYYKNPLIESLNIAGPYLNIKVSKTLFREIFLKAYNDFFKNSDIGKGQTIIVDYIGANVGKPLHIGHMCTPNQGQTIVNLYKKLGYNVIGDSHIGDWGIIFGRLIYAWKWANSHLSSILPMSELLYYQSEYGSKIGLFEYIKEEKLKKEGADFLMTLYQKSYQIVDESEHNSIEEEIRQEFKILSEGNPESVSLWQKFTKYSIDAMQIQLNRLHIKPDYDIGESFYEGIGLPKMGNYPDLTYNMKDIVKELIQKGIATQNEDNSVGVIFDEKTKIPSCILQKRDGTHGYLASDLASVKYRMQNFNPSKIVYFVDVTQQLHLKQTFEISRKAGWLNENTEIFHAYNGFISLKEGKMSTRKGNIIRLGDLLDEAISRAKKIILEKRQDFSEEELEKLANIIGIGAIKYGYLSKSRTTDVIFDWDEFMTFEGNSGPYIQYAYVRAFKILKKADYEFIGFLKDDSFSGLTFESEEEGDLVKELSNYKNILLKTAEDYLPHILAGYTYSLTKKFNSFYNNVRILDEENEDKKLLKLYLVNLFLETMKDSFGILGIELPEEM